MEISTNRNKWIVEWANEIIYAEIPIWEKCILTCTLTIEEAAKYFRIGEKKISQLADEHANANWLIMDGNFRDATSGLPTTFFASSRKLMPAGVRVTVRVVRCSVKGAAWATIAGQILNAFLYLACIWRFKSIRLDKKCFRIFLLACPINGLQMATGIFFRAIGKPTQATERKC